MPEFPKTIPLTIRGETREVEVQRARSDDEAWSVGCIGLYQNQRSAGKLWHNQVTFNRQPDGTWKPRLYKTFLNRECRLVAFNDGPDTFRANRSRHCGIGGI